MTGGDALRVPGESALSGGATGPVVSTRAAWEGMVAARVVVADQRRRRHTEPVSALDRRQVVMTAGIVVVDTYGWLGVGARRAGRWHSRRTGDGRESVVATRVVVAREHGTDAIEHGGRYLLRSPERVGFGTLSRRTPGEGERDNGCGDEALIRTCGIHVHHRARRRYGCPPDPVWKRYGSEPLRVDNACARAKNAEHERVGPRPAAHGWRAAQPEGTVRALGARPASRIRRDSRRARRRGLGRRAARDLDEAAPGIDRSRAPLHRWTHDRDRLRRLHDQPRPRLRRRSPLRSFRGCCPGTYGQRRSRARRGRARPRPRPLAGRTVSRPAIVAACGRRIAAARRGAGGGRGTSPRRPAGARRTRRGHRGRRAPRPRATPAGTALGAPRDRALSQRASGRCVGRDQVGARATRRRARHRARRRPPSARARDPAARLRPRTRRAACHAQRRLPIPRPHAIRRRRRGRLLRTRRRHRRRTRPTRAFALPRRDRGIRERQVILGACGARAGAAAARGSRRDPHTLERARYRDPRRDLGARGEHRSS